MRPHDRERIQVEVVHRVLEDCVRRARDLGEDYLQQLVNDTVYQERRRLDRAGGVSKRAKEELAFYQQVQRQLRSAAETTLIELVERLAERFAAEIVGNFNERVYKVSTTVVPPGLSVLLNAMSPRRMIDLRHLATGIADHVRINGDVDRVRRLVDQGTVVVVPTHCSHLDSIVVGYAVYLMGLPPLLYGAGINLFTNPMLSFFMHNLGAYRIDRKKGSTLYKLVLKEYTTCAMEMGYHQLFFPGGTRSRSGAVEQRLKKGLLGTAVRAYTNNLRAGRPKSKIFVVPCTISYKLVLEAEALIDDYLQETGQSRYIIEDDEFSRPRRVLNFLMNVISLDDEIDITFAEPRDVFGNRVDSEGNSLDPRGRVVDSASYVTRGGMPYTDEQRDVEYTNELAEQIVGLYLRDNMLMTTNVVARALFHLLRRRNPQLDLYRLLNTGGDAPSFSLAEVHTETDRILQAVRARGDAGPRLSTMVAGGDIQEIVNDALKHFAIYHTRAVAVRRGDRVFHENRSLLLYYGNRLEGYGIDAETTRR